MNEDMLISMQSGRSFIPPLPSKSAVSLPKLGRVHSFLSLSVINDQKLIRKFSVLGVEIPISHSVQDIFPLLQLKPDLERGGGHGPRACICSERLHEFCSMLVSALRVVFIFLPFLALSSSTVHWAVSGFFKVGKRGNDREGHTFHFP